MRFWRITSLTPSPGTEWSIADYVCAQLDAFVADRGASAIHCRQPENQRFDLTGLPAAKRAPDRAPCFRTARFPRPGATRPRIWCRIVERDKISVCSFVPRLGTPRAATHAPGIATMPNEPDSAFAQLTDAIAALTERVAALENKRKGNTAAPIKDFDWLVKHRSKNQRLALKLDEILRNEKDILDHLAANNSEPEDHRLVTAAGFLVSIIFSLWRAVFLCPPDYYRDRTLAAAREFLANVIEDNMINYTRDKQHQDWTFSYYLNSAALRLQVLKGDPFNILDPNSFSHKKLRQIWRKRKDAWCLCHEAAEAAVDKLETELAAEAQRKLGAVTSTPSETRRGGAATD
jgi:hypothetical protein